MTMSWQWRLGGTQATCINHTINSAGKGPGTNTRSCTLVLVLNVTLQANVVLGTASRTWPRGVTVSTLDSESSDRGSNPREA